MVTTECLVGLLPLLSACPKQWCWSCVLPPGSWQSWPLPASAPLTAQSEERLLEAATGALARRHNIKIEPWTSTECLHSYINLFPTLFIYQNDKHLNGWLKKVNSWTQNLRIFFFDKQCSNNGLQNWSSHFSSLLLLHNFQQLANKL